MVYSGKREGTPKEEKFYIKIIFEETENNDEDSYFSCKINRKNTQETSKAFNPNLDRKAKKYQKTVEGEVVYLLELELPTESGEYNYTVASKAIQEMPNNRYLENPEASDRCLPWSPELPDCCRMSRRKEKCLKP